MVELQLLGTDVSAEIVELVERVQRSVVQVRVHSRGAGAGVVWDRDGGIITNFHVVGEQREHVEVLLDDGRALQATVARRDRVRDLALLQVPAEGLAPAEIGDSDHLRVGEMVFALGHPWGQRGVTTFGIVSAIHERAIQSDVQLAPGNSGGPLVDAAGQVVGINSMIMGGDQSLAIPVARVLRWLARSRTGRAFLGVELRPVELRNAGARAAGLLVAGVRQGGPADQAGVFVGDVLLGIDGAAVPSPRELAQALSSLEPGAPAQLEVVRGGVVRRLDVTLGTA